MKKNINNIKIGDQIKSSQFINSCKKPFVLYVCEDKIKNLRANESIPVPVALLNCEKQCKVYVTSKYATLIYDKTGTIINMDKSDITIN